MWFVVLVLLAAMAIILYRTREQVTQLRRRVEQLETRHPAAARAVAPMAAERPDSRPVPVIKPPAAQAVDIPSPALDAPLPPAIEPVPLRPAAEDKVPAAAAPEPARTPPAASPPPPPPPPARPAVPAIALPRINFEELFGRRLPIWAGGATLAVAGVLIVKYSIDAGLLSPLVRVICGLLFGTALIGGAEAARHFKDRLRDPRVAQALSGAGIASLYASVLIAANLYHLIGPMTAFVGLAGVTALAMGLSLRFGAPSALLGLVGGLAAPALVGSTEPNIPLLSTYLALAVGGLCTLSRSQRWLWLGIGALLGGFGWGTLLLIGGALDTAASLSVGLYLVLIGIALPLLISTGRFAVMIRAAASLVAAIQIAALVATGGFGLLQWGLFGLIAVAVVWLSFRDERLVRLPVIGVTIGLVLLGAWPLPPAGRFALVALALAAIHALPTLWRLWRPRGGMVEAGQIAAIALGGTFVTLFQFHLQDGSRDTALALVALAAALLPAGAAALGWRTESRHGDARFVTLTAAAATLVGTAAALALPLWSLAPAFGLIAAALLLLSLRAGDARVEYAGWAFGLLGVLLLAANDSSPAEFARIAGEGGTAQSWQALARWTVLAGVAALFAWRARHAIGRPIAQGLAALLGYAAIAQIVPAGPLPLVPALALIAAAAAAGRPGAPKLLPAIGSLFALVLAWAAWPLMLWSGHAYVSLVGEPMLADGLPSLRSALLRLALPAAAIGAALWLAREALPPLARRIGAIALGVMGAVAGHILFKQILAIGTLADFERLGLAERTIWDALLIAIGAGLWRWNRTAGRVAIAAGLAHFTVYTLLLHNPLWAEQATGPLPLLNWLLPAYGLPLLALWLAGRFEPDAGRFARPRAVAQMVLIVALAFSLLRQAFAGSLLTAPGIGSVEDILRSVVAIALAVGFLLWGIRTRSRPWRIASLVLMIAAVIKVFLFDASGLDGLLRIGSFVALGFSLIGIGWLYSRQLASDRPAEPETGRA